METILHLSLDHEQWPEYRILKGALGRVNATFAIVRLFTDLGYEGQSGNPLGYLDQRAQKFVGDEMSEIGSDPMAELIKAGFLVAKENGLYCDRFVRLNPHLDANHKTMQQLGGTVAAYVRKNRVQSRGVMEFSLLIPPAVWTRPDGERMDHEEIRDVMMLIRGCDNARGLPDRPHTEVGFTQSLSRAAYGVLKALPAEVIESTLKKIVTSRNHPALPPTTEQLLGPGKKGKSAFEELAEIFIKESR